MKRVLITGGAGFIGSHVVRRFVEKYPDYQIVNIDKLTYAGALDNLKEVKDAPNYTFIKGDICDEELVRKTLEQSKITHIVHLAAESHVDRSIAEPFVFAQSNVLGTVVLLECAREYWKGDFEGKLFYQISTDEVYGELELDGDDKFTEKTPYMPHSPYSASKAAADHFVRAYGDTYGLPIVISNCSNNYGPNQYPEKLIPLVISRIIDQQQIPVYGNGGNIRDWLYVEDHVAAIDLILHRGRVGETYNIGGGNEWSNIDVVRLLVEVVDEQLGRERGASERLITFVEDRAGHDLRYAIDFSKLTDELGWQPSLKFEEGIEKTVAWYLKGKKE